MPSNMLRARKLALSLIGEPGSPKEALIEAELDQVRRETIEECLAIFSGACESEAVDAPGEDWADRVYDRIRALLKEEPKR